MAEIQSGIKKGYVTDSALQSALEEVERKSAEDQLKIKKNIYTIDGKSPLGFGTLVGFGLTCLFLAAGIIPLLIGGLPLLGLTAIPLLLAAVPAFKVVKDFAKAYEQEKIKDIKINNRKLGEVAEKEQLYEQDDAKKAPAKVLADAPTARSMAPRSTVAQPERILSPTRIPAAARVPYAHVLSPIVQQALAAGRFGGDSIRYAQSRATHGNTPAPSARRVGFTGRDEAQAFGASYASGDSKGGPYSSYRDGINGASVADQSHEGTMGDSTLRDSDGYRKDLRGATEEKAINAEMSAQHFGGLLSPNSEALGEGVTPAIVQTGLRRRPLNKARHTAGAASAASAPSGPVWGASFHGAMSPGVGKVEDRLGLSRLRQAPREGDDAQQPRVGDRAGFDGHPPSSPAGASEVGRRAAEQHAAASASRTVRGRSLSPLYSIFAGRGGPASFPSVLSPTQQRLDKARGGQALSSSAGAPVLGLFADSVHTSPWAAPGVTAATTSAPLHVGQEAKGGAVGHSIPAVAAPSGGSRSVHTEVTLVVPGHDDYVTRDPRALRAVESVDDAVGSVVRDGAALVSQPASPTAVAIGSSGGPAPTTAAAVFDATLVGEGRRLFAEMDRITEMSVQVKLGAAEARATLDLAGRAPVDAVIGDTSSFDALPADSLRDSAPAAATAGGHVGHQDDDDSDLASTRSTDSAGAGGGGGWSEDSDEEDYSGVTQTVTYVGGLNPGRAKHAVASRSGSGSHLRPNGVQPAAPQIPTFYTGSTVDPKRVGGVHKTPRTPVDPSQNRLLIAAISERCKLMEGHPPRGAAFEEQLRSKLTLALTECGINVADFPEEKQYILERMSRFERTAVDIDDINNLDEKLRRIISIKRKTDLNFGLAPGARRDRSPSRVTRATASVPAHDAAPPPDVPSTAWPSRDSSRAARSTSALSTVGDVGSVVGVTAFNSVSDAVGSQPKAAPERGRHRGHSVVAMAAMAAASRPASRGGAKSASLGLGGSRDLQSRQAFQQEAIERISLLNGDPGLIATRIIIVDPDSPVFSGATSVEPACAHGAWASAAGTPVPTQGLKGSPEGVEMLTVGTVAAPSDGVGGTAGAGGNIGRSANRSRPRG